MISIETRWLVLNKKYSFVFVALLWLSMFILLASFIDLAAAQPTSSITAATTQIFSSMDGLISYIDRAVPAEKYSYKVNFVPPDGISKLLSAEIKAKGDFLPASTLYIKIEGADCNPIQWELPASHDDILSSYEATFECVDVAKGALDKEWTIDFSTNAIAYNVRLTYKVKYLNDWNLPEQIASTVGRPIINMHGTEYFMGDIGKIWLQLLDTNGSAVNNGVCYVDIYYPYGARFIEHSPMNFLEDGVYYYDVIIPEIIGVYPAIGLCYYTTVAQTETADSGYINIGTLDSGSYTSTQIKDNVYWKIDELKVSGIHRLDFGENFTNINPPALLTGIDILWSGKWNGGTDALIIYVYNFTSSSWLALMNTIPDTGGARIDISNSIATTNATVSGLLSNNETRIRIVDATSVDGTKSKVQTDYLVVNFISFSSPEYQEVKGSSEINVKSSETSKYVKVETLCGGVLCESASICGEFVNYNTNTNYTENEILENITVTSLVSLNDTDTHWEYWTPMVVDCTAIYWIKYNNGTEWVDVTDQAEMHSHLGDENCHIKFPLTADIGETYEYAILMDNYQKWEVQWVKNVRDAVYMLIYPPCTAYANLNNYTYTVPILDGTFVNSTDIQLGGCHRFLDDIYWIDLYYNLSLNATNVINYSSYFLELRWYETALRQHNQLYSSNVLSTILASQLKASDVWNYATRNLTDYNHTALLQYLQQINITSITVNTTAASIKNDTNIIYSFLQSMNTGLQNSITAVRSFLNEMVYLITDAINSQDKPALMNTQTQQDNEGVNAQLPVNAVPSQDAEINSQPDYIIAIVLTVAIIIVVVAVVFIKNRRKVNAKQIIDDTNTNHSNDNPSKSSISRYTKPVDRPIKLPDDSEPQHNNRLDWGSPSNNHSNPSSNIHIRERISGMFKH